MHEEFLFTLHTVTATPSTCLQSFLPCQSVRCLFLSCHLHGQVQCRSGFESNLHIPSLTFLLGCALAQVILRQLPHAIPYTGFTTRKVPLFSQKPSSSPARLNFNPRKEVWGTLDICYWGEPLSRVKACPLAAFWTAKEGPVWDETVFHTRVVPCVLFCLILNSGFVKSKDVKIYASQLVFIFVALPVRLVVCLGLFSLYAQQGISLSLIC